MLASILAASVLPDSFPSTRVLCSGMLCSVLLYSVLLYSVLLHSVGGLGGVPPRSEMGDARGSTPLPVAKIFWKSKGCSGRGVVVDLPPFPQPPL